MSLRDLCDVAYVMQVEAHERYVCALVAAGADVDRDELRTEFDAAFEAEVTTAAQSERSLMLLRELNGA